MTQLAENISSRIEREITLRILRGDYPAGMRLPPVRELAESFEVNPSTIQRVVARLETRGLIRARQGSGLAINDPAQCGDITLLPLWLETRMDHPQDAADILADLLEVRRILASRLVIRHRHRLREAAPELLKASLQMMDAEDVEAIMEADLKMIGLVVARTQNLVAMTVFNTVAEVVRSHRSVAEAMYAEPARNMEAMAEVVAAFDRDTEGLSDTIDRVLMDIDQRTVARFLEHLEARS